MDRYRCYCHYSSGYEEPALYERNQPGRWYFADEVDEYLALKNEEVLGLEETYKARIRELEDTLKKAREYVLDGLRGALAPMREGQLDYDEILKVIDQALGKEEE
jgi:hypothetical protein